MNDPPTKEQEINALLQIATDLGPNSYLGPWIRQSLPYLADAIKSDVPPISACQLYEHASEDRITAAASKQIAQQEARLILDSARHKADELHQEATAEAERITGNAWQALRHAMKSLEA
jgi:cell division septum initiation protein DivIVA